MFVIWYSGAPGLPAGVCEIDGGICYDVYRTEAAAQASCDEMNAMGAQHGWAGRYTPMPAPAGLQLAAIEDHKPGQTVRPERLGLHLAAVTATILNVPRRCRNPHLIDSTHFDLRDS